MPYIYKYTDEEDNIVKYVGIIRKDSNFPNRFYQHISDTWYSGTDWKIEYAYYESVTDVEMLEGHLIAFYGTSDWYNKAKSNWGLSSFKFKIPWVKYVGQRGDVKNIHHTLYQYRSDAQELEQAIKDLSDKLNRLCEAYDNNVRNTQISWLNSNVEETDAYVSYNTDAHEAYNDYTIFCEDHDDFVYMPFDEWIDALYCRQRMYGRIRKNEDGEFYLKNIILKSSADFAKFENIKNRAMSEMMDAIGNICLSKGC